MRESKNHTIPYLPVAIFTTAYGRCEIIKAVRNNIDGDRVLYCDTDSMVTIGDPKGLEIHDTELGK